MDDSIEYFLSSSNSWQDECPYASLPYHSPSCICKKNRWNELDTQTIKFETADENNIVYNYGVNHSFYLNRELSNLDNGKDKVYDNGFTTKQYCQNHTKTQRGKRLYKCDICDKVLSSKGSLLYHTRSHSGEKPYSCDICGKGFSQSSNLKRHSYIHSGHSHTNCNKKPRFASINCGENPYKCEACDGTFSSLVTLRSHMETHLKTLWEEFFSDS